MDEGRELIMARTVWFRVAVAIMTDEDTDISESEMFDALRDEAMNLTITADDGTIWGVYAFGQEGN